MDSIGRKNRRAFTNQSGIIVCSLASRFAAMLSNNISDNMYNDTTVASGMLESDGIKLGEFFGKLNLTRMIIIIFIAILIICGNTLVLLATWKERSLHEPNKYFIACLAVADLLVGILVAPLRLYQLNFDFETVRDMSVHLCRFYMWIDVFALTASIYSLTFISFDRYLKISKPLQYKSRMTTSKSLKIIFIIWFISTVFATYAATPHSGSKGVLVSHSFCPVDRTKSKGFYTFLPISAFFLPTGVISVMYTLIFVAAHKRQKMLRNGEVGQACGDRNQRTVFLQDLKVIRMLLVVMGVFLLCWGPLFIYALIFYYKPNFENSTSWSLSYWRLILTTQVIIFVLPYLNSMCNPIIYACLDQKYRQAFKHLFQRMICQRRNSRRQPPDGIGLRQLRTRQT